MGRPAEDRREAGSVWPVLLQTRRATADAKTQAQRSEALGVGNSETDRHSGHWASSFKRLSEGFRVREAAGCDGRIWVTGSLV